MGQCSFGAWITLSKGRRSQTFVTLFVERVLKNKMAALIRAKWSKTRSTFRYPDVPLRSGTFVWVRTYRRSRAAAAAAGARRGSGWAARAGAPRCRASRTRSATHGTSPTCRQSGRGWWRDTSFWFRTVPETRVCGGPYHRSHTSTKYLCTELYPLLSHYTL